MKIKLAIEKAIEGGWRHNAERVQYTDDGLIPVQTTHISDILLDPKFWQALGKSEGWERYYCIHCENYVNPREEIMNLKVNCNHKETKDLQKIWLQNMHQFIDNLAQGQSLEEAFDNATK